MDTSADTADDAYLFGWTRIMNMIQNGGSWSGHERNCCFLNTGQKRFANVSSVAGLDFPDDSRCVAPVDWDHDGDLDLWLSARTGPTLRLMRNNNPDQNHYIAFRLRGTTANRDGIGARIEVATSDGTLLKSVHACNSYLTQASLWVHFGLGSEDTVSKVVVRWPGGEKEQFSGIEVDRRFVLEQGTGTAETWAAPNRTVALQPSQLDMVAAERASRIVLRDRVPMPAFSYGEFDGTTTDASTHIGKPLLVSLWAAWCAPCLVELKDFTEHTDRLRSAGLHIVALNVETAGGADSEAAAQRARSMIREQIGFPFTAGLASPDLLEKLDALQDALMSLRAQAGQLPSSFLFDRFGRLAVVYQGSVSTDQLLQDVQLTDSVSPESASLPFSGVWINEHERTGTTLLDVARKMRERGLAEEALRYGVLAADVMSRQNLSPDDRMELAQMFFDHGFAMLEDQHFDDAARFLGEAVRMRPEWVEAHVNLGNAWRALGRTERAVQHLSQAVQLNPQLFAAHFSLGVLLLKENKLQRAAQHLQAAVQIDPQSSNAHHQLGLTFARLGLRQEAIIHLRQAVQADAGNTAAQRDLQSILSGQVP